MFRFLFVCLGGFCFLALLLCVFHMKVWHQVFGERMLCAVVPSTPGPRFAFIGRVGLWYMVRFGTVGLFMVTYTYFGVFVLGPLCGVCDC